jgi:hypothetical protein
MILGHKLQKSKYECAGFSFHMDLNSGTTVQEIKNILPLKSPMILVILRSFAVVLFIFIFTQGKRRAPFKIFGCSTRLERHVSDQSKR